MWFTSRRGSLVKAVEGAGKAPPGALVVLARELAEFSSLPRSAGKLLPLGYTAVKPEDACLLLQEDGHLYEVVKEGVPVCFFADVEWVDRDPDPSEARRFVARLANALDDVFNAGRVAYAENTRRVQLGYKHSYHLVFPEMVFETSQNLADLWAYFATVSDFDLQGRVDLTVYTKNRLFRLPNQTKGTDPTSRFKVLQGNGLRDFLVTSPVSNLPPRSLSIYTASVPQPSLPYEPVDEEDEWAAGISEVLSALKCTGRVAKPVSQGRRLFYRVVAAAGETGGEAVRRCPGGVDHSRPGLVVVRPGGYAVYICNVEKSAGHVFSLGRIPSAAAATSLLGEQRTLFTTWAGGDEGKMEQFKLATRHERFVVGPADFTVPQKQRLLSFLANYKARANEQAVVEFIKAHSDWFFGPYLAYLARFDQACPDSLRVARNFLEVRRFEEALALPSSDSRLASLVLDQFLLPPDALVQREGRPTVPQEGVCTIVRAEMGAGKTFAEVQMVKQILQRCETEGKPAPHILSVNPRRVLSVQKCERYQQEGVPMINYQDAKGDLSEHSLLSCQIESLYRLEGRVLGQGVGYDILLLDELNTLLSQLLSSTNGLHATTNHKVFEALVRKAGTIYAGDALLDAHGVEVLRLLVGQRLEVKVESFTFDPFPHSIEVEAERRGFCDRLFATLESGGTAFLGTASVRFYERHVQQRAEEVLAEQGRSVLFLHSSSPAEDRNKQWDSEGVGLVVVTPVNTIGYSYEVPEHFTQIFIFASTGSCDIGQSLQQSRRVRYPRDSTIVFYISCPVRSSVWDAPEFFDVEETKARLKKRGTGIYYDVKKAYNAQLSRTGGSLDGYVFVGVPDATRMPDWLLHSYAFVETRVYLHRAFPHQLLNFLCRLRGVEVSEVNTPAISEGEDNNEPPPPHWWDSVPLVLPETAAEYEAAERKGESDIHMNRCLKKFHFCRLFQDGQGRMMNVPYELYQDLNGNLHYLYTIAAFVRGANRDVVEHVLAKAKGWPVEKWSALLTRVNVLQDIFSELDKTAAEKEVTLPSTAVANGKCIAFTTELVASSYDAVARNSGVIKALGGPAGQFYRGKLRPTSAVALLNFALGWIRQKVWVVRDDKGHAVQRGRRRDVVINPGVPASWADDEVRKAIKIFKPFS